jgi:very-short-patch-repair endonuclease/predicted nucleic-acid-binding Zn-ribbon protein
MRELIRHIIREHTLMISEQRGKKMTTDDFIRKAKEVHGDKYDYSEVDYKNQYTPVKIICPIHGAFMQTASHLRGAGCNKCGQIRSNEKQTRSGDDFINKVKEVHGNKYDFSKTNYSKALNKVVVTCPNHGDFLVRADHLLRGQGCPKCAQENTGKANKLTRDEFITKSNLVHDDKYDYSQVEYDGVNIPVKIICPLHGEFLQTPNNHMNGNGCKKCGFESISKNNISNTEDFIKSAKIVHGDKYDYSQVDYKLNTTPVKIKCSIHGEFVQSPAAHLRGQGCPICQESTGEKLVSTILEKQEVKFLKQHKFVDCTNKKQGGSCRKLPFDFYIPELNVCIEYDGRQHFEPIIGLGGERAFENQKIRDKIKTEYCEENGIKLIRVPYTMKKEDIEPYILSELGM